MLGSHATHLLLPLMLVAGCAPTAALRDPVARHQLVVVLDGLRPDYVTPELMPHLHALAAAGTSCTAHHAVFPTLSGVNATSLITGATPQAHGLLGNNVYLPEVDPDKVLDIGLLPALRAIHDQTGGRLLGAPTLGQVLDAAGQTFLTVAFTPVGIVPVMTYVLDAGAALTPFSTWPVDLHGMMLKKVGLLRPDQWQRQPLVRWVVDAYLAIGLDEMHAAAAMVWITEPDHTSHAHGVGDPETIAAVRDVDDAIGRLLAGLEARGMRDAVNLFVVSDHGISTVVPGMDLDAIAARFDTPRPDGRPGLIVTRQGIYQVEPDPDQRRRLVEELQRTPGVGALFTAPAAPGSPLGVVPGTLSFDLVHYHHPRVGAIAVAEDWDAEPGPHGYPGRVWGKGLLRAGHGSLSRFDVHATLIAAGPDIRRGVRSAVPSGSQDLAPTLLHLLGLDVPGAMDGRVLTEILRGGPAPDAVAVTEQVFEATAPAAVARYRVRLHTSSVGRHRYIDYAEVER